MLSMQLKVLSYGRTVTLLHLPKYQLLLTYRLFAALDPWD